MLFTLLAIRTSDSVDNDIVNEITDEQYIEDIKQEIDDSFNKYMMDEVEYTHVPEFDPTGDYSGIKAITYSAVDGYKVFAYIGFPDDCAEDTSSVILVHGGGGHSYLPWIKQWNEKGYIAIAPDVTGYFPTAVNAGASTTDGLWIHELNGIFEEEGKKPIPDNDGFSKSAQPLDEQWIYHVLVSLEKSYQILGEIAPETKTGVCSVSWGAVVSTIFAGYENRLAWFVPVYGSTCLSESKSYMGSIFSDPLTKAIWEDGIAEKIKCPVFWMCSDYDENFSVNSNSDSFLLTRTNEMTRIAILSQFKHSHENAWEKAEPFMFAEAVLECNDTLPGFETYPTKESVECKVVNATRARLYYLTSEITFEIRDGENNGIKYPTEEWKKGTVNLVDGKITGTIPENAAVYYVSISGGGCTVSTPIIEISK